MDSLADVARAAAASADALAKAQRRGVSKAALHVTKRARANTRTATGGDMRLSGVGRRGARLGVRYDVKGRINPSALIRVTGPYHLAEHDTSAHDIPRANRRRKKILKFPDGGYARTARHPGSRGRQPFARAVAATRGDVPRIIDE